jgi:hypothetical protein
MSAVIKRSILLEHLVGQQQEGFADRKAENFRCFEIDGEFELVGGLHRQIARVLTFENAIDI